MPLKKQKNIVVIGGGTGVATVLSGLKYEGRFNLTAVVPVSDQGGSSGEFIKAFEKKISLGKGKIKIVPPGDVANAITSLSYHEDDFITLLNHRTLLNGHNPRNIIVDAAIELWGIEGIEKLGEFLKIRGKVFPVADQFIKLRAVLEDGSVLDSIKIKSGRTTKVLKGEEAIDFLSYQNKIKKRIKRVELIPLKKRKIKIYKRAKEAILNADIIIFTPSDLWTSTIPILLVPGVKEALKKSQALTIYFCPLMSKYLHTDNFTVWNFIEEIEKYSFPRIIKKVFYNSAPIPLNIIKIYEREKAGRIMPGKNQRKDIKIIKMDLLDKKARVQNPLDKVKRSIIRHDPLKILKAISSLG